MKVLKLGLSVGLFAVLLAAPAAYAQPFSERLGGSACKFAPFLSGCANSNDKSLAATDGSGYLAELVGSFIFVAAIVAFIFLLVGGIKYITSTGDPARIQSAKNTIQYAIIGLILAIIAQSIVGFVIGRSN